MDLKEFVDALSFDSFNELRKVVVDRHQREAAEFFKVLKYLQEEKTLSKSAESHPFETIKVLSEKTECSPELCARVLGRYLEIANKKAQGLVERPFDK